MILTTKIFIEGNGFTVIQHSNGRAKIFRDFIINIIATAA
jgi:hypothetical protein